MLNNEFPPVGGGTATVNLEILRRLSRNSSIEVDLITCAPGSDSDARVGFPDRVKIFPVSPSPRLVHHTTVTELGTYAWNAWRKANDLCRHKSYDLCLAWSALPAGAVAGMLRARYAIPYIVRVCGPDIPGFESRYRILYPFLGPFIRWVCASASRVVAKCESEVELLRGAGIEKNVSIIHNGVDGERFRSAARQFAHQEFRLLCVGRLIARKGQRVLLRALRCVIDRGIRVRLHLVGSGDDEQALRQYAASLQLSDSVTFIGAVPRSSMPAVYAGADAFVLPSANEGMSVAVLEAMASGLPLVVSDRAADGVLRVGVNGLVFPHDDARALAEVLIKLIQDRALLSKFSSGSASLSSELSWDSVEKKYSALFSEVLSTNR